MASKNSKQGKKPVSAARRRAEAHSAGGGDFSTVRLPEGLNFYKPKEGVTSLDIIPFKAGKGNTYADPGELYFERTYFAHRNIGVDQKAYVCPAKAGLGKCPICQEQQRIYSSPDADVELGKSLLPKQRQLFLVYDYNEADKGIQLWDISFHNFGKLLDGRIRNSDDDEGYDMFYFPGADGLTLKVTIEEENSPYGNFLKATAIDFKARKDPSISEKLAADAPCLDDLLKIESYDFLKKKFLQLDEQEDEDKPRKKSKPVEDEEEEDEEDDTPAPKSSGTSMKTTPKTKSGSRSKTTEPEEEDEDEDLESDRQQLMTYAASAAKGNKRAIAALDDRAEAAGLDPEDYSSPMKLAKAIIAAEEDEEEEDDTPPPKSKKPTTKKKDKEDEEEWDDSDDDDEDDAEADDTEDDEEEEDEEEDEEEPVRRVGKNKPAGASAKRTAPPASKGKTSSKPSGKSKKVADEDEDEDWEDVPF